MTNARDMLDLAEASIAAAGCDDAEQDALALVAEATGMAIEELSQDGATEVTLQERRRIEDFIARREDR